MIKSHLISRVRRQLKRRGGTVATLFLACMMALLAEGCQTPAPPARIACGGCEGQDRIIRLQPVPHQDGEPGFTHPFLLSPEDWKVILKSIHVQGQKQGFLFFTTKGPVEPAFTNDEIEYLSATLSRVFGQARPDEQVVFALSRHQSADLTEVTSGGWFVNGPSLHLVLANYRYAVTMPTVLELMWRDPLWTHAGPFYDLVPGEHQTLIQGKNDDANPFRSSRPSQVAIEYRSILLPEIPSSSGTRISPGTSSSSAMPPLPPERERSLEERLRQLKRFKEQGLVTEEEYGARKKQLLDHL